MLSQRAPAASFAALALSAFTLSLAAQDPKSSVVRRTPTAIPMKVSVGVLQAYVTPIPRPTVPAVEGHPLEKAVLELRRRDFSIEIAGDEPSTTYAPGSVARQDPPGGSPVPPGSRSVRLWRAVPPPLVTVAEPTLTPTAIETATAAETVTPEAPPPTPAESVRPTKKPTRLPPVERPPTPTRPPPPPPPPFRWIVVIAVAALGAAAYLALRRRPPGDGRNDSRPRAPDVELVPRTDDGEQEIVSTSPLTRGLTLHPVVDPGEQTLEVNGPLLAEGREP